MSEEPAASTEVIPTPKPEYWRSVLSVLSFALGLISFLTCIFGVYTGIPAIVLGILARRKMPQTGKLVLAASMAKKGIILGVIGTVISAVFLFIVVEHFKVHEAVLKASCQNNLKSIGACLKLYAQEHNGMLPGKLSELYPVYLSSADPLVCPASGNAPGDPARIDEWSNYTYVPGLHMTGTPMDAQALVCYDNEERHTPPGRNELYLDGHVEYRVDRQAPRSARQRQS